MILVDIYNGRFASTTKIQPILCSYFISITGNTLGTLLNQ